MLRLAAVSAVLVLVIAVLRVVFGYDALPAIANAVEWTVEALPRVGGWIADAVARFREAVQ